MCNKIANTKNPITFIYYVDTTINFSGYMSPQALARLVFFNGLYPQIIYSVHLALDLMPGRMKES